MTQPALTGEEIMAWLERTSTGWNVLFYLIFLLLPLTYFLKKEFWRDVH